MWGSTGKGNAVTGDEVEILHLPNRLKQRSSLPGGRTASEMVEAGEAVIGDSGAEFTAQALRMVGEIERRAVLDGPDPRPGLGVMRRRARELYDDAGLFHAERVGRVAERLLRFLDGCLEEGESLPPLAKVRSVVLVHVQALRLSLGRGSDRIDDSGDGAVLDGLDRAARKVLGERA